MAPLRSKAIGAAVLGGALALAPLPLAAHGEVPSGPGDVWNHWPIRPTIAIGLLIALGVYTRGLLVLWRRGGTGRVVSRRRAFSFLAGVAVLVVALLSPLDPLGEVLFSAHMIQHLLLILVAAPLIIVGAPEVVTVWAIPDRWRKRAAPMLGGVQRFVEGDRANALSVLAILVATGVLWAWHAPRLYDLAVQNELVHATEHGAFLVTALLFWAAVLRLSPRARLGNGLRVLYVFAMAVQGSILGALITFSQRPLYQAHANIPAVWGIDPLPDQQLAGLIMWVPPALLYIGVAAYLFVNWLEAVEERSLARERREERGMQDSEASAGASSEVPAQLI